jgi:hypothetical protein
MSKEHGSGGLTISTAVEEADSVASRVCKGETRQQQSRGGSWLSRDVLSRGLSTALSKRRTASIELKAAEEPNHVH